MASSKKYIYTQFGGFHYNIVANISKETPESIRTKLVELHNILSAYCVCNKNNESFTIFTHKDIDGLCILKLAANIDAEFDFNKTHLHKYKFVIKSEQIEPIFKSSAIVHYEDSTNKITSIHIDDENALVTKNSLFKVVENALNKVGINVISINDNSKIDNVKHIRQNIADDFEQALRSF